MRNKKGFTLAELLIVVAIIAVLVAIAIPIFVNQLEKANEATDQANIRDYYAEIATALVTGDLKYDATTNSMKVSGGKNAEVTKALATATGEFEVTVTAGAAKQNIDQWQTGDFEVAGVTVTAATNMKGTSKITYTFKVEENNTYLKSISFPTT